MKARALRFLAPCRVGLAEVELPSALEEGELLVRTEFSGISAGSELLAYRGEVDPALTLDETLGALAGTFAYPFSYGYSAVGRVERSRATVPEGALVFAFHPHQDRFVVRVEDAVQLDGVDARSATLLPLVETALQVCLDAATRYGDDVAVTGLGPVGILAAALIARTGARVLASDPREDRRKTAELFRVRAVAPADLAARVEEATEGRGVAVLVEASGDPGALVQGLSLLAHEGTALVCSWYGRKEVPLPLGADFHRRRLVIRSSQVSTIPRELAGRWTPARRRAVARGLLRQLPVAALASHEFPFEQAADAYAALARGEPGMLHVALCYG